LRAPLEEEGLLLAGEEAGRRRLASVSILLILGWFVAIGGLRPPICFVILTKKTKDTPIYVLVAHCLSQFTYEL